MRTISFDTPASPAASQARLARINASHSAACVMQARRHRYYPAPALYLGGLYETPSGRFTTAGRPSESDHPNAGRDCSSPDFVPSDARSLD